MSTISRTILMLSMVSLFTDMASEMLYPVMPAYLRSIGFSMALIGLLEGLAEAVAGLSKGYFGHLSDSSGKRLPFVRLGYTLSALSKPLLAVMPNIWWIFGVRTMDRLGKGLRTGARDAMLADESDHASRGAVFGFHRSMDTLGAALGPALALAWLYFHPGDYTALFLIAFLPGLAAVGVLMFMKEKRQPTGTTSKPGFGASLKWLKTAPAAYRKLLPMLLIFALVNSSDVFLLLRARDAGISDSAVIGIYIFYNLVYALFAWPLGRMGDKFGLKKLFILGLLLFAAVYAGMAFSLNLITVALLFFLYGIYAAATEGVAKAWISQLSGPGEKATALGAYAGLQSICALLASLWAGLLWDLRGPEILFIISAAGALLTALWIALSAPAADS